MPSVVSRNEFKVFADFLILCSVSLPIPLFFFIGNPFVRGFYCGDSSIEYYYKDSTVTSLALYLVGTLIPLAAMLMIEKFHAMQEDDKNKEYIFFGKVMSPYLVNMYKHFGVFLFACATSQTITDIGKYTIGRLRPHFLAVCNPDWTKITCENDGHPLYVIPECRPENPKRLSDARLSFPSGHASFSAVTMIYLMIYLQHRMPSASYLLRPLLQMAAFTFTIYTSLSRVSDYKHHWSDVLAGFLLGSTVAFVVATRLGRLSERKKIYQNLIGRKHTNDVEMVQSQSV